MGDARLAERLVANLVDNAVRHNVPGGRITVRVGAEYGQAVLAVANSGPVVPPGEVGRLFAPFQRLGASRRAASSYRGGDQANGASVKFRAPTWAALEQSADPAAALAPVGPG